MAKGLQIGQLPKRDVLTGNEQFPFQEDRENGSITPNALKSFISSGKGGYMSYITEYNVSIHHPSSGIDGGNKYTLEGAIVQVPEDIRMVGLKVSFLNNSGLVETWEFAGGVFENIENWKSNEDKLTDIRDEAISKIKEVESDAISNFSSQRVIPDMLSESTKQFINASGGGTINNLADDEDLVSVDKGESLSVLKFADRAYNPGTHVGMGYKILRRNIIDGKNILTQEMINQPYTIYVVQYDFDLNGATITLPEGCMFDFQGGSISNGFLEGKIENTHARPEWFHSPKDNDKVIRLYLFSTIYSNSTAMLRRTFNSDERHKIYLPLLACGTAILIDDGETIVGNSTKWEIDDEDEKYNIIDEQSSVGFVYQNNGMNVTVLLKEIPTEGQWVAGDSAYVKGHKYQYDGTNWLDKNGIIANTRKQGNSENRPTNVPAGFYYFDTSLNKPVWKKNDDTNEWVDASGVTV